MYPDFAYSRAMQVLLVAQTYITHTVIAYLAVHLVLSLSNEKPTAKHRLVFAVWTGAVLQSTFMFGVYIIGGMVPLSPLVYTLAVYPNAAIGYACCFIGTRVLKLSQPLSLKLMGYHYAYLVLNAGIAGFLTAIWPIEEAPRYNYLQCFARQGVYLLIFMGVSFASQYAIRKTGLHIRIRDKVSVNITKERILCLGRMLTLYGAAVFMPMLTRDAVAGSGVSLLVLSLIAALTVAVDLLNSAKNEAESKAVHIGLLSKTVRDYSRERHNFNNILQTYGGYIALGSLDGLHQYHLSVIREAAGTGASTDLGRKMDENPAFIETLSTKSDYAKKVNVDMKVTLKCCADQLFIDNLDACRCVAYLLDNAIESAAESERKQVFFTLEQIEDGSKLITVAKSGCGPADIARISAAGHLRQRRRRRPGLSSVRKTLSKYNNCALQMTCCDDEFSARIVLGKG